MDWKSTHFDWNNARAFLVTAEEGSFSAAGRALGIAQPTVGRQVAALEKELNVVLFDRVGKQLIPTNAGLELVDHVRQMYEAATKISMTASGQSSELVGEVRITAIDAVAAFCLPTIVQKIRSTYPGILINVITSNEIKNLGRREADIAIRNVQPLHPDLIAKKVCDVAARLYGAKSYLKNFARPLTPELLAQAEITGFSREQEMVEELKQFGLNAKTSDLTVVSENHLVQWEMIKQGVCLGMMMEHIADKEPLVERVFEEAYAVKFPVWLVAHQQLRSSKPIKAVFDMLAEHLLEFSTHD